MDSNNRPLVIAAQIAKEFEGFSAVPYLCPAGKWTIGYGTTMIDGKPVNRDTPPVTEAGAMLLMQKDLAGAAESVNRLVTVRLTDNQRAALIDFVYNLGSGAFAGSTLRSLINRGLLAEAAGQFDLWIYARNPKTKQLEPMGGLRRRRALEKDYFMKPDEV